MPQFARPDADLEIGNWLNDLGSAITIFQSIDEVVANDADFIESGLAPVNDPFVCGLSDVEDPLSSSAHIVRWRRSKDAAGGSLIDLTVELRQGYVSEASQGTQIFSIIDGGIPDVFTDTSYTLSGAEADAITDYNDLQLRITAFQP